MIKPWASSCSWASMSSRVTRRLARAYAEGRAVIDVAEEETEISRAELETLLDPAALTRGGIQG